MAKSGKSGKHKSKRRGPAGQPPPAGLLIALDGTGGSELDQAARKVVKQVEGKPAAGLSRFDSSNTFFELRMAKGKRGYAPPQTLVLLYASDLLFRLRWEIRPALAEGRTVVAAPYVQTVIGFGVAAGLPRDWLEELFAFAPAPDIALRLKEKRRVKEKASKGSGGYLDFCCWNLTGISPKWTAPELRCRVLAHLDELEGQEKLQKLGKKLSKKLLRRGKEPETPKTPAAH